MNCHRSVGLVPMLLLATSCSTGGSEERDISEVKIQASHFMFGFGGDRSITRFPIPRSTIGSDIGILAMTDTGQYTIDRAGNVSGSQSYSLAADGTFHLVVPVNGAAPTRFVGAYREDPKGTEAYFFTDRFAPTSSPVVGLFWGVPKQSAPGDPVGSWFLFSQHVIFSKSTFPDENEVGRSIAGEIVVAANGDITGTGLESTNDNITFLGKAVGGPNGAVEIPNLDFRKGVTSDLRSFECGHDGNLILGLDEADTKSQGGLLAMMRQFDPLDITTISDEDDARRALAGTYEFGMHTIFIKPGVSGIDAANGTIVFNDKGGWTLEGVGSKGPSGGSFDYAGSYRFEKDPTNAAKLRNRIILSVDGPPKETWTAAVDLDFNVVVLVDNDAEDRRPSAAQTELNLVLALRKKP